MFAKYKRDREGKSKWYFSFISLFFYISWYKCASFHGKFIFSNLYNCRKAIIFRKQAIGILISILVFRKLYIVLFLWPDKGGPYPKIDQNDLQIDLDENGNFWIIDKPVQATNQVNNLKNESFSVLALILSAPKNFIQRHRVRFS